jgi:predicted phage tail protein
LAGAVAYGSFLAGIFGVAKGACLDPVWSAKTPCDLAGGDGSWVLVGLALIGVAIGRFVGRGAGAWFAVIAAYTVWHLFEESGFFDRSRSSVDAPYLLGAGMIGLAALAVAATRRPVPRLTDPESEDRSRRLGKALLVQGLWAAGLSVAATALSSYVGAGPSLAVLAIIGGVAAALVGLVLLDSSRGQTVGTTTDGNGEAFQADNGAEKTSPGAEKTPPPDDVEEEPRQHLPERTRNGRTRRRVVALFFGLAATLGAAVFLVVIALASSNWLSPAGHSGGSLEALPLLVAGVMLGNLIVARFAPTWAFFAYAFAGVGAVDALLFGAAFADRSAAVFACFSGLWFGALLGIGFAVRRPSP